MGAELQNRQQPRAPAVLIDPRTGLPLIETGMPQGVGAPRPVAPLTGGVRG